MCRLVAAVLLSSSTFGRLSFCSHKKALLFFESSSTSIMLSKEGRFEVTKIETDMDRVTLGDSKSELAGTRE